MAYRVTYMARIEVSDKEIISIMTVEYAEHSGYAGVSWTAQSIGMTADADGHVLYGPCGDRVESGANVFGSHEDALADAVRVMLGSLA